MSQQIDVSCAGVRCLLSIPTSAIVHCVSGDQSGDVIAAALQNPHGLPPLPECVVPGDRVVVVVDPFSPGIVSVLTLVWEQIQLVGPDLDVTLLLPADETGKRWEWLIDSLPVHVRTQAALQIHDPDDEQQRRYLASSAGGERIYLSHHLVDADLIVTVGAAGFDCTLGYRGTTSAVYPAMSDSETIRAARRLSQVDLMPDDPRPLRELVDEIGWLLGTQFTIQLIPDSSGGIGSAFCGAADKVMELSRDRLKSQWWLRVDESIDLAVVSVQPSGPSAGWKDVGAAIAAVLPMVSDGGRIAVIADVHDEFGPGMEMLRRADHPGELLKPLRREPVEDSIPVTQIITALDSTTVYLLSSLNSEVVDELGMLPLESAAELQRLLDATDRIAVIRGGNYAWSQVTQNS